MEKKINQLYFRNIFILFMVLAMAFAVIGCDGEDKEIVLDENGENSGDTAVVEEAVTVRLAAADGGYPTPFMHYPRMRGTVMKYIFDSLLEPDGESCIPWLAKEWQVCEEGVTHTVSLEEGVLWHDGTEMTAADVVFSFNYYREHPPIFIGEIITQAGFIKSIEALSDYQVKIVTESPNATFKCEAGMLRIIPEHIWKDVSDPYDYSEAEAYIGCGPYLLKDYSQEHNTYRYEAFEDYWGPKQRVSVIEYVPVSDEMLAFEKGDISITRLAPDLLDRFAGDERYKTVTSPAFAGYMISFNMNDNPLFRQKLFRQALAYAVDKNELIEKAARGAAKPGSAGILPVDHQFYNPNVKSYEHNPGKARQILDGLGVEEGRTFKILVGEGPDVRIGEILKEQFAKAGINLDVEATDAKTRDSRANEGKYELVLLHMGAWGLDADFLRIRYHSRLGRDVGGSATAVLGRNQGFQDSETDTLSEAQVLETDYRKRRDILFSLQARLAEEVPEIPLYNVEYYYTFRPAEYDGWTFMFDHAVMEHAKLSYLRQ